MMRYFFVFLLILSMQTGWASGAKPDSAVSSLQGLGFTLLQGTPIEFELPSVGGGNRHLRDSRGKWVFLAFWATWCGACNEEMPQLEALYRKFKKDGLSVVGVSIDQDRSAVERFRREKDITFPILLDDQGTVSSKYQASALPTLYVISPDWKLVGVLRGAREWGSPDAAQAVTALLRHHDYNEKDVGIKLAEDDGALSLPNNLVPPVLSLSLNTDEVRSGTSLPLSVTVSWRGNPKEYLIKVPKLTLPEGITQGEVSSTSTSDADSTTLRYDFPLNFRKDGSFKIGPVELAYSPRSGGKELFARSEGLSVQTKKQDWTSVLIGGFGAAVLAGLGFLWRKRARKPVRAALTPRRNWSEPYEAVRRLKMAGKTGEYAAALVKLYLEIEKESGSTNQTSRELFERVNFGGSSLSEVELSTYEKKVERAIQAQGLEMEEST